MPHRALGQVIDRIGGPMCTFFLHPSHPSSISFGPHPRTCASFEDWFLRPRSCSQKTRPRMQSHAHIPQNHNTHTHTYCTHTCMCMYAHWFKALNRLISIHRWAITLTQSTRKAEKSFRPTRIQIVYHRVIASNLK